MDSALSAQAIIRARKEESISLGMWIFLLSELMLFGGLIFSFLAYRSMYGSAFAAGSAKLHIVLGTVNTALLLTSSVSMALAVFWTKKSHRRKQALQALLATEVLGLIFLGVKGSEYVLEYMDGLFPWGSFAWQDMASASQAKLFFTFYFLMTGLHAFHMCLGIAAIASLALMLRTGTGSPQLAPMLGLYWHFVDIVWVFLFPLLYLNGRA